MSVNNLGHATAYGYAKSKGYTGTEEEFAELMASYADVAQDAQASAEAAAGSATAAAGSANTATTAAQTATTKANEAAQSATGASQSATQAASAVSSAQASAQTATAKASEASQSAANAAASATTANNAADDATAAKTAAETAKTAAQQSATSAATSAQTAQQVLEDIPEDYSDLSNDVSDLLNAFTEVTEPINNLIDWSLLQIGKNYIGETADNRAVLYLPVEPSTDYYIYDPANANIPGLYIAEKAAATGGSSVINGFYVDATESKTVTTNANTHYLCIQFNGSTTLTESDFQNYALYVTTGLKEKKTAVDDVARSAVSEISTFSALAEAKRKGLSRVGGYEFRNSVENPSALTHTQNAHSDPYYDVNRTVDEYMTVNYNKSAKYKNILNSLPQTEVDFTPSANGFTRIIVGKDTDDRFFTAYVASNRTGQFGNAKLDALEVTSDFVNFTTVLKGCEPANTELVNPSDWQVGKNWIGSAAANRAVIYVPVTAGQIYDVYVPVVDWAADASIVQKSGNQGGSPNKGTTSISNGVVNVVEAKEEVTYFCYQINGNRTITAEDVASYALSIALHDTRGGIVVPNMTNIKVASIKQFCDGTYLVAIRCKDVRDNSNYTHFYRMTANMQGITHCTYTNFDGNVVSMVDEFGGDVYDWHVFMSGKKCLATTYGNRDPQTDYGRVWYTENCGYSWKQVFQTNNHLQDGQAEGVTVTRAHTHGVMIDQINDITTRLYVLVGEDNSNIFWTDKGMNATDNDWNVIDIHNQPFYNFQTFTQVVNGYPFKDALIFGSDNEGVGCVYRINKLDGGKYSNIESAHEFLPNYFNGTTYCAAEMSKRDETAPLLLCETHESAMFTEANNELLNEKHKARIVATYDGVNIMEVWQDDTYGAHDAYIDGQTVSRNYSYCTRGMGAWLLKNGDIVIKYSGRDYYYFGGNPLFSVTGISNGSCKVKVIKNAEKYL